MPAIDASIPLGYKQPDQTQQLSGLLNMATSMQNLQRGAQGLQQDTQKTQQGAMDLSERQAMQQVLADPKNYTADDGSFDPAKAQAAIMRAAPTTGTKYWQALADAHQKSIAANQALNTLTTENRQHIGSVLAALPPDATPELVGKTVDALRGQYKGIGPAADALLLGYQGAMKQGGPQGAASFIQQASRGVLPQETQQTMNTPAVAPVSDNQHTFGVNVKPGVPNMPIGAVVPGTSVQMQLPPGTPTVGPNNQPGYVGPQGAPPKPGAVPNGYAGGSAAAAVPEQLSIMAQERAKALAQGDQATVAALDREMVRLKQSVGGFVPSGPAPGANESKAGSIATVNQHWDSLNKQAETSQLMEGVLGNIKALAPGAITGTESGRKAYLTGLLNSLHLGNQATGDLQKDTDLLEKNIAQLGLNTPATTDAMRTIVSAARPHSTMSKGAIEEAAAQITGQIQAQRAVRNALSAPKQIANQTGDPSAYESVRSHIEEVADPRAWQFQSLDKDGRAHMLSKLTPADRTALRAKIEALHGMGLLK